jgi:hypothetical protein
MKDLSLTHLRHLLLMHMNSPDVCGLSIPNLIIQNLKCFNFQTFLRASIMHKQFQIWGIVRDD